MILDNNDYETLTPFPILRNLNKIVPNDGDIRNLTWKKICNNEKYGNFVKKMFYNKEILLYAQRHYLSTWFSDTDCYGLDDTNVPFDCDHISPSSAIRHKKNIHEALKDWYPSNGNIRAWPYSLNRKDQDDPPSKKLLSEDGDGNRLELLVGYAECKDHKGITDYILRSSFCERKWHNFTIVEMRNIKNIAKELTLCILSRNVSICKEWYEQLCIDDLLFQASEVKNIYEWISSVIDSRKWEGEKDDDDDDRFEYIMDVGLDDLFIYFSIRVDMNALKEDEIEFGVYRYDEEKEEELALDVKIPKASENDYIKLSNNHIYKCFTLMSFEAASIHNLFNGFYCWLSEFPDKELRATLMSKFGDSIRTACKDKVIYES